MLAFVEIDSKNNHVFADDSIFRDISRQKASIQRAFFLKLNHTPVDGTFFNVHSLTFERHFIGFFFYVEYVFKIDFPDVFLRNKSVENRGDIRFFAVIHAVERKLGFVYRKAV